MQEKIFKIRADITQKKPLIHCITNPISINQCANAILAVGARPIMAEHPREVAEITETAQALMLNLGNITDVRMESIAISAAAAAERNIPFVLDAVGIACSKLRQNYTAELLNNVTPSVIKGNYSEINALYQDTYRSSGVDADSTLELREMCRITAELAKKKNTIILASGKTDIVSDGHKLVLIHNGTAQLSNITGTGCMLGALCAAYLSSSELLESALTACTVLGICGQLAATEQGSGTFMTGLMDNLSTLTDEDINKYLNVEVIDFENN